MIEYEIISSQRGIEYVENIKASSILEAIGMYYSSFGYQRIISIRLVE